MKTTVRNASCKIYTFEDMEIYIIDDQETANVYIKNPDEPIEMYFIFAVESKDIKAIDIEQLHNNGYFDINSDVVEDEIDYMLFKAQMNTLKNEPEEETK